MTTRLHRTQILLKPKQHRALSELAHREGRSLSDIVREFVQVQLEQRAQDQNSRRQRQLAGLEQIRAHRQALLKRQRGEQSMPDPVELIDQLREERDAELTALSDRR